MSGAKRSRTTTKDLDLAPFFRRHLHFSFLPLNGLSLIVNRGGNQSMTPPPFSIVKIFEMWKRISGGFSCYYLLKWLLVKLCYYFCEDIFFMTDCLSCSAREKKTRSAGERFSPSSRQVVSSFFSFTQCILFFIATCSRL